MEEIEKLISILETSVEKNGEKPLTNKWLLNIVKMLRRELIKDEAFYNEEFYNEEF